MRRILIVSALALVASTSVYADPWPEGLPPCPASSTPPRFYPEPAIRRSMGGDVLLSCTVGKGHAYDTCAIASETPEGVNFGPAAIAIARCTKGVKGKPGSQVELPVHFRLPGRDMPEKDGITVTAVGHWGPAPQ